MSAPDPQVLLCRGDLVEDREVADADGDQLSHAQIATQLAELVRTVPAPSNIALYGPWGSGKSGIGNLMKEELARSSGIQFARFDAFKYAETPLRRNFVSAVATELGIGDEMFHEGLYTGHTRTDVKVPATKIAKILGVFAALTLVLSAILVGVVAIIAALESGPYGADFSNLCKTAVAAGLLPAALLSALITLANRTLQVDRSIGKPDSDEQFERIFSSLVARSKADRLVVFVDELDRCAAAEVVATLDAIRTFLGVPQCVFVIAADQQVLEESLTREARQETPADEVNPYYSTGSAYLDKVFQYQISLPPLMSQRITRFAADLVKERSGLWSEINSDYVVSVLVPTHVTSPRRVKHLLNAFALTYRLAQDRHNRGLLAEDPREHAASVAKLVCLRVEFPLFARDLEIDARLPSMVLQIASGGAIDFDGTYPAHAVRRAIAYGRDNAPPAGVIADSDDDRGDSGNEVAGVEAQSNRQLLDYLRRTKTVPGPSRDLVFLHSTGTAFGLDGEAALAIEAAAENADPDAVRRRLDGAAATTRSGIIQLLNHLIRTLLGVGGPNAARTLLGVYDADPTLPVESIADSTCEMIAVLAEADPTLLDEDTIAPAWRLAELGSEAGALQLRNVILAKADATGADFDVSFVLQNPAPALAGNHEVLARLVAREFVREDGEESVALLRDLNDSVAVEVVRVSSLTVSTALREALEKHQASSKSATTPSAPAVRAATAPTPEPEAADTFDPQPVIAALADYARDRALESPILARQVILTLLRVNAQPARVAVEELIPLVTPATEPEVVAAILAATRVRILGSWPRWLAGVSRGAVTSEHAHAVSELAMTLWRKANDPDTTLAAVEAATPALSGVVEQLPERLRPSLTDVAVAAVAEPVTDDATAEARSLLFRNTQPLAAAAFVDIAAVYRAALPTLRDTFAVSMAEEIPADGDMARYLSRDAVDIVRGGVPDNEDGPEQLKIVLAQLTDCVWVAEPRRTELLLKLMAASGVSPADLGLLPSADEVTGLIEKHGATATVAVAEWIPLAEPDPASVTSLFVALREQRALSEPIVSAVVGIRRGWTKEQRVAFLRAHVADPDGSVPDSAEARLIGLRDIDPNDVTTVIIERFGRSTNNTQRKASVGVLNVAGITDGASRKRLIESTVIPMLKPASGSPQVGLTEVALDVLALIGAPLPRGVKGALGEAVKGAVSGNGGLERKAVRVLEPLGYRTHPSGWLFNRKKSVDYSE